MGLSGALQMRELRLSEFSLTFDPSPGNYREPRLFEATHPEWQRDWPDEATATGGKPRRVPIPERDQRVRKQASVSAKMRG